MIHFIKNGRKALLGLIISIAVIATSGYALLTTKYAFLYNWILLIGLIIMLCLNPKLKLRKKKIILCFAWISVSLVSTLMNLSDVNINAFLSQTLLVVFCFILTEIIEYDEFIKGFTNIMFVVSIISIVMWVLLSYFHIKLPFREIENINGAIYQNGLIWFRYRYGLSYSSRIIGLFWEPGIFATFLNVALAVEFLNTKIRNKLFIIVFVVAIILTQSTAGYIMLCLSLMIRLVDYKGKIRFIYIVFLLVALCVLIMLFEIRIDKLLLADNPILNKLSSDNLSNYSRVDSIKNNLEIFMMSPIYGHGLGNANLLYSEYVNKNVGLAQTSTSGYWLMSYGVLGFGYTLAFVLAILRIGNKESKTVQYSLYLILLLFALNKEPHSSFSFTFCLLFYLFSEAYDNLSENRLDVKYGGFAQK